MYHTPVLLEASLGYLALAPGASVIDATVGDGGHSQRLLDVIGPAGRLLGLDTSPVSLERAAERLGHDSRLSLVHANFAELAQFASQARFSKVDGILFDLGLASWQLDEPGLGLSFQRDEPLDMRLDHTRGESVRTLLARITPRELEQILEGYGDLARSRVIVRRIVDARRSGRLATTGDLVEAIGTKSPTVLAPIFQALRIAVNDELQALEDGLDQARKLLAPTGRLVVISYHSGEDRIVKHSFRQFEARGVATVLTKRPICPSPAELHRNPRSRSAKLRAVVARSPNVSLP